MSDAKTVPRPAAGGAAAGVATGAGGAASAAAAAGAPRAVSFSVATLNVLAQAYARSRSFPYVAQPGYLWWEHRCPLLINALKAMDADIVCLQEVDRAHDLLP